MKTSRIVCLLVLAVCATSASWAQKDSVRTGPAVPPVIDASEDTFISYMGGEPPLFTGANDADDTTYNRATTCATLSAVGTAVAVDTLTITNNSGAVANMVVFSSLVGGGACGNANDTFFTLYNGTFNPATPLANCLAVNDDIAGAADRCSTLTFSIPVGETRVIALATFDNPPTGLFSYQVNFTGTTPVELLQFSVDGQ
jgi:hypothetical protein